MFIACAIVGWRHREIESQVRVQKLTRGTPLVLLPEPENPHDKNAVKVMSPEGLFLGYIPRQYSEEVAEAVRSEIPLQSVAGSTPASIIIEST